MIEHPNLIVRDQRRSRLITAAGSKTSCQGLARALKQFLFLAQGEISETKGRRDHHVHVHEEKASFFEANVKIEHNLLLTWGTMLPLRNTQLARAAYLSPIALASAHSPGDKSDAGRVRTTGNLRYPSSLRMDSHRSRFLYENTEALEEDATRYCTVESLGVK